jgi:pimeloyl-ACP methyl ester carboxylesterase
VRAFRWVEKVHVFGYQWGAQAAALFAEAKPNKVARLALFGMRYQLFDKIAAPKDPARSNSATTAMLKPDDGDIDPAIAKKRAEVCALGDVTSPNGALKDLARASRSVPKRVTVPTLLINAERESDDDTVADRLAYFKGLGTPHKWFVLLPGLGKYALVERQHGRFEKALLDFLDAP